MCFTIDPRTRAIIRGRLARSEKFAYRGNMRKKYKADVTCDQNKSVLIFTVGKGIVDILNFTLI